ncbi:MAG: hypothetical protein HW387_715 [Parachlamydiales bacterium]|nr:hypothetical protein [Parachlamydiales bacterium]
MKSFSILWMLLLTVSCFSSTSTQEKQTDQTNDTSSYTCTIPITKLTSTQNPCVEILIENKPFTVDLDLGFKGAISILDTSIDQILSKTLIGTELRTNILGKQYLINLYSLPEFKIGTINFSQFILLERNTKFINDVYFSTEQDVKHPTEVQGSLGWELFYNSTLLIDIKNLKIVVSDSLETLQQQGFSVDELIKTPLFTERGLVELETETNNGPMLCVLDTGCTLSVINSDDDNNKSVGERFLDPENVSVFSVFKVGENNFGPISFRNIPIKTPFRIEAILGMDFFENHVVVLDFVNKFVYLSKSSTTTEKSNLLP